jgi:hypothetical protein
MEVEYIWSNNRALVDCRFIGEFSFEIRGGFGYI